MISRKKYLDKLTTFIFYFSILIFIIAFNFSDNGGGGWYQQFMPSIGGRSIVDITFTDSLNGYAVTTISSDTSYILKTTNGGDNWFINHADSAFIFARLQFINQNTGFAGGLKIVSNTFLNILKTTNAGVNWFYINAPFDTYISDMSVLNEDTILFVMNSGFGGGVYRTINGGLNWTQIYSNSSPDKIYMYNSRIGFVGFNAGTPTTKRTTNGGFNWTTVLNDGFVAMNFVDSLTGWKAYGGVKKTTDGGISWISQKLPSGGNVVSSEMKDLSIVNRDTVWGVGGFVGYKGIGFRGLIYRTTNGGITWLYQVPDTNINIFRYNYIYFNDPFKGWAYSPLPGVHTIRGGDSIFYPLVNISQISSEVPTDFKLNQNYPNPFNPSTTISFKIKNQKVIKLIVYDILGKEISILVNEKLNAGEYKYLFDASSLSSGIYFYSLFIDGVKIDTKKMLLVR